MTKMMKGLKKFIAKEMYKLHSFLKMVLLIQYYFFKGFFSVIYVGKFLRKRYFSNSINEELAIHMNKYWCCDISRTV